MFEYASSRLPNFDIKEVSICERCVTFYFNDGSARRFHTRSKVMQKKSNDSSEFDAKTKICSDEDMKMFEVAKDIVRDSGIDSINCSVQ